MIIYIQNQFRKKFLQDLLQNKINIVTKNINRKI